MSVIFAPEMKLILLLLSLTISTISANANEKTREEVKNYKAQCYILSMEDHAFNGKFVLVSDIRRKCSCLANNFVQGLDTDVCKPPRTLEKREAEKYFSWD